MSNLIWGKPGLEEQAEGVYDASGPHPLVRWMDTPNRLPLGAHGQAQRGQFVTSGTYGF